MPVDALSEDRYKTGVTFARLLKYDVVTGHDSAALKDASRRSGMQAVYVVPWGTDDRCQRVAWTRSGFPWSATDTQFLAIAVRPERGWINGVPTADFEMSTRTYPVDAWNYNLPTPAGEVPDNRASAREYFGAYKQFPTTVQWECAPRAAYESLRTWLNTRPGLGDRAGIREMVESIHEALAYAEQLPRSAACRP